MKSHNIIVIAPTVLGLGGQVVEALGVRTYGHKFDSRIRSPFFFFFFVSRIRDNSPVRVKVCVMVAAAHCILLSYSPKHSHESS